MKRHPTLATLSRDHHGALILAQLLKRNAPVYKGLPTDEGGKVSYAMKIYQDELEQHFLQEEKMMDYIKGTDPELDEKIKEIESDHVVLRELFAGLKKEQNTAAAMDALGFKLEKHVRTEERELFPLVERKCDDKMMSMIEKILTS